MSQENFPKISSNAQIYDFKQIIANRAYFVDEGRYAEDEIATARAYILRFRETQSDVNNELLGELIKTKKANKILQVRYDELRELLREKTNGTELMIISFFWALGLSLVLSLWLFAGITLIHPLLSGLGIICASIFFFIGYLSIKEKKLSHKSLV